MRSLNAFHIYNKLLCEYHKQNRAHTICVAHLIFFGVFQQAEKVIVLMPTTHTLQLRSAAAAYTCMAYSSEAILDTYIRTYVYTMFIRSATEYEINTHSQKKYSRMIIARKNRAGELVEVSFYLFRCASSSSALSQYSLSLFFFYLF